MRALILTLATLTAASAHASWFGTDCQEQAERSATQSAAGVTKVVIVGRAGFLHIEGHSGATAIHANGTACAAIEEELVGIRLEASRSGSEVRIEAVVPNHEAAFFASSPKLDFTVTVPAGVAVDVVDTSGEMTISDVGSANVNDTSGSIEIRHVTGDVTVRDTSGEIDIEDVGGNVRIPSDSSGSIDIRRVRGNVTIDDDGSGSVNVSDVGGDFLISEKGSGSIGYDGVKGHVSVPARHRHRD